MLRYLTYIMVTFVERVDKWKNTSFLRVKFLKAVDKFVDIVINYYLTWFEISYVEGLSVIYQINITYCW